jgi:hypothetical protein
VPQYAASHGEDVQCPQDYLGGVNKGRRDNFFLLIFFTKQYPPLLLAPSTSISTYPKSVEKWLKTNELKKYLSDFKKSGFNTPLVLPDIDKYMLDKMKIEASGHTRLILCKVRELRDNVKNT